MIKYLALILCAQICLGVPRVLFAENPGSSRVFNDGQSTINDSNPINAAQDPLEVPKKTTTSRSLVGSQDPSKQVLMAILEAVSQRHTSLNLKSSSERGGIPPIGSQSK
jgi:hypothetical protein